MRVLAVVVVVVVSTACAFTVNDNFGRSSVGGNAITETRNTPDSITSVGRGTIVPAQGFRQPVARTVSGNVNTGVPVGSTSTLDQFGSALGAGTAAEGIQRGAAQVSLRDRVSTRDGSLREQLQRKIDNGDVGAGRRDEQERSGSLLETSFNRQDNQAQDSSSHQSRTFDQNFNQASEQGQRQNDVNDKHGGSLQSVGRVNRQNVASNNGDKALTARKNAFTRQKAGIQNVDYGFKKGFDTNFNERGGFQESVGQDNLNMDVYEEKQRDNRFSKGLLDAFRRSSDLSALRKDSDWLSNAAQRQDVKNGYGTADRLRSAAEQQHLDWNALVDRKNNAIWNRDIAQDQALREANDIAEQRADQRKKALAEARGNKGVQDNKYYGGETFGKRPLSSNNAGTNPTVVLGTGAASSQAGAGNTLYAGTGPVTGSGIVNTGGPVGRGIVSPDNVKGRHEGSGGDYVNQYQEKARQADLAEQLQSSNAQSDAKALNNYSRGRGVDDSIEVNGQREGKWSKDKAGINDANSLGFNAADAGAAKSGLLADRNQEAKVSNSRLEAAKKNLQAQQLDRINFKKNEVDSTQKVRKQKKFYHDKVEGGFNNEALNYNQDKAERENGEEQQAQKAARTNFNNAAEDAKVNTQGRAFNNLDVRKISNADAVSNQKDSATGWLNENRQDTASAAQNRAAFQNGRQNQEFDSFARAINNRNQQLWDQARRDVGQRQRGSDTDRAVEGRFLFNQDSADNTLGLGTTGQRLAVDPATGSSRNGQGFGSGISPSFSQGSSFRGGFDSPVGSFMSDIGKTSFGQTPFGSIAAGTSG